jgi:hypothetical protein
LDDPDIGAAFQQMGREAVAQRCNVTPGGIIGWILLTGSFMPKTGGGWIGNNNVTVTSVTIVSDT